MTTLSYEGVSIELPLGWDGAIHLRPIPARELSAGGDGEAEED